MGRNPWIMRPPKVGRDEKKFRSGLKFGQNPWVSISSVGYTWNIVRINRSFPKIHSNPRIAGRKSVPAKTKKVWRKNWTIIIDHYNDISLMAMGSDSAGG
jgi:hypothetical protein